MQSNSHHRQQLKNKQPHISKQPHHHQQPTPLIPDFVSQDGSNDNNNDRNPNLLLRKSKSIKVNRDNRGGNRSRTNNLINNSHHPSSSDGDSSPLATIKSNLLSNQNSSNDSSDSSSTDNYDSSDEEQKHDNLLNNNNSNNEIMVAEIVSPMIITMEDYTPILMLIRLEEEKKEKIPIKPRSNEKDQGHDKITLTKDKEHHQSQRPQTTKIRDKPNEEASSIINEEKSHDKSKIGDEHTRKKSKERSKSRNREKKSLIDNIFTRREKIKPIESSSTVKESSKTEVSQFKDMQLTNETTALGVLTKFRSENTITNADAWTLFEINNEYGLERPFRDWESVARVIQYWEVEKSNALVIKKYAHRNTLSLKGFAESSSPTKQGWLNLEGKKGKWQKRYFNIRDGSIYHSKDLKGTNETFLCALTSFDVYTTLPKFNTKAPTKFIFVIKSQDKITMFENPEDDYMHVLCANNLEEMQEWILRIRTSRNYLMREESPATFSRTTSLLSEITFELASFSLDTANTSQIPPLTSPQDTNLSSIEDYNKILSPLSPSLLSLSSPSGIGANDGIKKKKSFTILKAVTDDMSSPFASGSLLDYNEKNPPLKQTEPENKSFFKGSLLATSDSLFDQAKEREKARRVVGGSGYVKDAISGTTLVNIGDSLHFQKGSLLSGRKHDNPENTVSSPSTTNLQGGHHYIQLEENVRFNKGSLLAKGK
nr:8814_t:CDS:10 [Entrophospora candida]